MVTFFVCVKKSSCSGNCVNEHFHVQCEYDHRMVDNCAYDAYDCEYLNCLDAETGVRKRKS